jgi:hypothetical protein
MGLMVCRFGRLLPTLVLATKRRITTLVIEVQFLERLR